MVFSGLAESFIPLQNPRYVTVTEIFSENEMRSKEALNQLLFYRYFVVKDKNVLWVISNKIAFFYSFIMYPIVIISSNFLIVITMDIWKRYYIAWCKQYHIFFQISIHDTCFPCWSNLLRILFFSLYLFSSNSDNDILRFFLGFFSHVEVS